jgi:hypothetical protein
VYHVEASSKRIFLPTCRLAGCPGRLESKRYAIPDNGECHDAHGNNLIEKLDMTTELSTLLLAG